MAEESTRKLMKMCDAFGMPQRFGKARGFAAECWQV